MVNPPQLQQQTEEHLRGLEGLEAVRLRPGMYVGGTDIKALHHLVYEVVDNAIDEAMAGRCDFIEIVIHADNTITVHDNGGGIPVGINHQLGISTLTAVFTRLHFGGKFGSGAYSASGGLHGIGVKAVNALSDYTIVKVRREGYLWQQTFSRGEATSEVEQLRELEPGEVPGTSVSFMPDATIMQETVFDYDTLEDRFRQMAYLVKGVTIRLVDERIQPLPKETTFYFEGGLRSFVRYLNRNRDELHGVIAGNGDLKFKYAVEGKQMDGVMLVDFALQYADTTNTLEMAFANTIHTREGGSHLTGMRTALTRVLNNYARKAGYLKDKDSNFTGSQTLEGLTAIVAVRHPNPQFENQTKNKLMNTEVSGAVSGVVADAFTEYLENNPKEAKLIIEKCLTTQRIQDALAKQRELLLNDRKTFLSNTTLPGKLADCSERGLHTELFIVEGDSAGGCFSGDTRVALADGRSLSFLEIIEEQAQGKQHFCYTIRNDGTIGLQQIVNPRRTKQNADVVRVTLDNGENIVCTPDHRFMLRDGSYKAAADLTSADSLMPFHGAPEVVEQQSLTHAFSYNHRIVSLESVSEHIDVYDIEVPGTHNFALESGVFVHNSAKQARDRHFQAILPVFGKMLNTERVNINKILESEKIRMVIMALGTGIREDFNVDKLRYGRIILMSVAGDEPTLVLDRRTGQPEFVKIGELIDDCLAGRRHAKNYSVMSFDQKTHQTRFKPLKAVIRHEHDEPMYKIVTRYNRSLKVTASHSVFAYENGKVVLKKGGEIKPGDLLVASRRLPRPVESPTHIDLLTLFRDTNLTAGLYVKGEAVRQIAAARYLNRVHHPELVNEPRIVLSQEQWQQLIAHRQAKSLSQMSVAQAIGVKQPITISHWERRINRPIISHYEKYLSVLGIAEAPLPTLLPSKLEERLTQDDTSHNARWRQVSQYKLLKSFTDAEIAQLDANVELVPQAHLHKSFARQLPITTDLLRFLGWFMAEGTLSKHQVSLNLGEKDARYLDELSAAIMRLFGEQPRRYNTPNTQGYKFYFQSVQAARLIRALGLNRRAHEKAIPNFVFSLSVELQQAFLEGYFLGDGTISGTHFSFTTTSVELKEGLLYLLGQLGILASVTSMQAKPEAIVLKDGRTIANRRDYFTITVSGKEQLAALRGVWARHSNAAQLEEHLSRPAHKSLDFQPISDDLIGLQVITADQIDPVGQYVYDFSVQDDENFICGTGGICAHNSDADVDGSHIRTLMLTFFYRYMQPIVSEGRLFIAQPPIYRMEYKKQVQYVYPEARMRDEQLMAKWLKNYTEPEKVGVQRYKGLGEMNPEQLWETTMNPEKRLLLQVTLEDAAQADQTFDMLMGPEVPPRRNFIIAHSKDATLDI